MSFWTSALEYPRIVMAAGLSYSINRSNRDTAFDTWRSCTAPCLNSRMTSIVERTQYPSYEILVVDNDSDESETLDYLTSVVAVREFAFDATRVS